MTAHTLAKGKAAPGMFAARLSYIDLARGRLLNVRRKCARSVQPIP